MSGNRVWVAVASALLMLLPMSGCSRSNKDATAVQTSKIIYHAVLLDNSQVYFGKVKEQGGTFTILTDVYHIRNEPSADGKQSKNVLIKRGREWHAPNYM